MALPELIEKSKRDWIFKVTKSNSKNPERDLAILSLFFGSGLTTFEINRIQICDVLSVNGVLQTSFDVRGNERLCHITNSKLRAYVDLYINHRVKNKIALGNNPDQYKGLNPFEALFISAKGKGFSIVKRETSLNPSYACDALNRLIKTMLKNGGIESPSILSGRRTMAVNLYRAGYDLSHIHYILGNKTLETTNKLIETDEASMAAIAKAAF